MKSVRSGISAIAIAPDILKGGSAKLSTWPPREVFAERRAAPENHEGSSRLRKIIIEESHFPRTHRARIVRSICLSSIYSDNSINPSRDRIVRESPRAIRIAKDAEMIVDY